MIVDNPAKLRALLTLLAADPARVAALDTETSGLNLFGGDRLAGLAVAVGQPVRTFYLPFRHGPPAQSQRRLVEPDEPQLPLTALAEVMAALRRRAYQVVLHNAKFDWHVLANEGVSLDGLAVYDTMVMARIADPLADTVALKRLAVRYLGRGADREEQALKDLLRRRGWLSATEAHYDWLLPSEIAAYAEADVRLTLELYDRLWQEVSRSGQANVLRREMDLLPVLVAMERRGMRVDRAYCEDTLAQVRDEQARVAEEIYALAGQTFNLHAHDEVDAVLAAAGLVSPATTSTGKASWTQDALLATGHPLAERLVRYRSLHKLAVTYFQSFLTHADADDVIHPDYQQVEAVTGRTSCRSPNLQNLTADGEKTLGYSVRRAFVPRPGYVYVLADWSQMELRIAAELSADPTLLQLLRDGADLHLATARRIATLRGLELCDDHHCPTVREWRRWAKTVTFGVLYGMGPKHLARTLAVPLAEATAMWESFWAAYPQFARWNRAVRNRAVRTGEAQNPYFARRYRLAPNPRPQHAHDRYLRPYVMTNYLVQGTGAEIAKIAMVEAARAIAAAGLDAHLVAMIHDELIWECPPAQVPRLVPLVQAAMTDIPEFRRINVPVEIAVADRTWADKRPYDAVLSR